MSTTTELHRKDAELQAVRAELVALRAGVEALASQWERHSALVPRSWLRYSSAAIEARSLLAPAACGRGVCAANDGHEGTCAEASGWDDEEWKPEQVDLLAALDRAVKQARADRTTDAES